MLATGSKMAYYQSRSWGEIRFIAGVLQRWRCWYCEKPLHLFDDCQGHHLDYSRFGQGIIGGEHLDVRLVHSACHLKIHKLPMEVSQPIAA